MLKKMLKYDMRSVGRIWWIMAVSVLGLSVIGAFVLNMVIGIGESMEDLSMISIMLMMFGILFLIACVVGIIASTVVTTIFVYLRFYKHFFTDEGYLTFTLPVSRKTLLLSKSINAMIWTSLHLVLIFVSICIFTLGVPAEYYELEGNVYLGLLSGVGDLLRRAWDIVGSWLIVYLIEAIIALAVYVAFSVALVQFCITIASVIAKKAKLLVAVGIYYAANTLLSLLTQMLSLSSVLFGVGAIASYIEASSPRFVELIIAVVIMLAILMLSAVTAILYFNTLGSLERKLNLS